MNQEPFETASETPETPEEARLRSLFRRTAPRGPAMDLEAFLAEGGRRGPRRPVWKRLVAAALLVISGVAIGSFAVREEARREMEHLESSLRSELDTLRGELVSEVAGALARYSDDLLDAQQDGIKKLAILLRNDYRPRLARLRSQVEGLVLAMEHPVRRGPGAR